MSAHRPWSRVAVTRSEHSVAPDARATLMTDPGFGRVFTDHMATASYSAERGWHDLAIVPRAALPTDPAASVFHYAQEVFEGLKAYAGDDGTPALFRPEANAQRMRRSAERLAMPPVPEAMFLDAVRALVDVERDWVPRAPGALYLRPFVVATEAFLGVRPAARYQFVVLACTVGDYFRGNKTGVSIWATDAYTRAAPGGTGEAKCGGNYASSLIAQAEATAQGCDQVLFLDAAERRFVEELGGMNVMFVHADGRLTTPPLTGTILPGITRDSLLTLGREMGMEVAEEPYALDQWRADAATGRLAEAFACGTAAVVTPILAVKTRTDEWSVGGGEPGPVTTRLRARLVDLQHGRAPDPHGWCQRLDADAQPALRAPAHTGA